MPIDDEVSDNESSSDDDDVSMSSIPVVPLLLSQPVPPFPVDYVSIHSADSTTDADISYNDDDSATIAPADIPAPIIDAPADAPADHIPVEADAAARDLLVPKVIPPDAPDDVSIADVADPPDDVSIDDVSDASSDVTHEAPDPVAFDFDVLADDDAVEVTIDEPTNTYNLRSRSAPTFGSYSNPNNVQLHQQTHPDLDFSITIDTH